MYRGHKGGVSKRERKSIMSKKKEREKNIEFGKK
jgi:hypothetical protein